MPAFIISKVRTSNGTALKSNGNKNCRTLPRKLGSNDTAGKRKALYFLLKNGS